MSGELFKDGFDATWYAPLDLYVKCSYSSDYKDELTINDKGYIKSRYQFDSSSNQWIVNSKD